MSVIIDTDVFDIGKIIKVDEKNLPIKRSRFIVEIFMMEMIERFLFNFYKYIWHHFILQCRNRLV